MSAHTRLTRAQARLRRAARAYAAADTNPARERTFHDLTHAATVYAAAKADVERERAKRSSDTVRTDAGNTPTSAVGDAGSSPGR